jgi:methylenetetrahydrofolate reductase (NADPH)
MRALVPTVSFEFFPPQTEKGEEALWDKVVKLAACDPAFMTVTYGACGSTRDKTVDLAIRMRAKSGRPSAAHLTFIATPKNELRRIADKLWGEGVRHIVALRGDLPAGTAPVDPTAEHFAFTSDFVESLKSWHDFEISVGAYPEKHPAAPDLASDLEALRKKCGAGADRAITQFFFDNAVFYRFRDVAADAGIETPIVPGILPIVDYEKMLRFAQSCQASVPPSLAAQFERLKNDPEGTKMLAADLLVAQVTDLAAEGVPHLHFYTLNQSALALKAVQALNPALQEAALAV